MRGFRPKRELAALIILYDRGPLLDLGSAIDILSKSLCVTKKTSRNIIKRLRRIGALYLVKEGSTLKIEVKDPLDFIRGVTNDYIAGRRMRCKMGR